MHFLIIQKMLKENVAFHWCTGAACLTSKQIKEIHNNKNMGGQPRLQPGRLGRKLLHESFSFKSGYRIVPNLAVHCNVKPR